jgi:hypothetical protein
MLIVIESFHGYRSYGAEGAVGPTLGRGKFLS